MAPRRVLVIFGTRPEAIKLAPVVRQLHADPRFAPVVVVTAQHRQMLDQVLDLFGIRPDHDLDLQQPRQSLTEITTRALGGLSPIVSAEQPDLVVVQGDTTTTFAGALAGFYHQIPVAHVEAGLRTGHRYSPFPEEINRKLTTQLTSLHLAPTPVNVAHLRAEGVAAGEIVCTGNTVIDALREAVRLGTGYGCAELAGLDQDRRRIVLVTTHRRESWGAPMGAIARAVARLAADPAVHLVVPLHLNPIVRDAFLPIVAGLENVTVTDPLAYGGFARLLARCDLVLTDSGGIQEEAPSLAKPVLVLRDTTERPEAVLAGTVELVGTDEETIFSRARTLLDDPAAHDRMARAINPYGDGQAAPRCVQAMAWVLGLGGRPADFCPSPGAGLGPPAGPNPPTPGPTC